MEIIIHGRDCTEQVHALETEHEVAAYFDEVRDRFPVGDESKEHWQNRNNKLLAAMLYVLTKKKQTASVSGVFSPRGFDALQNYLSPEAAISETDRQRLKKGAALPEKFIY